MSTPAILLPSRTARERAVFPLSVTQQKLFGSFLLLHGLAHAGVGIWAGETGRWWFVTSLWELAMVGFLAAGLGALGLAGLRDFWRSCTIVASVASMLLLLVEPAGMLIAGLSIDFIALSLVAYSRSEPRASSEREKGDHSIRRLLGIVIGWAFLLYVATVIALRPWDSRWGTTDAELMMPLPGDEFVPLANYRIDHALTINAPSEAVWPWLIQIGQGRGGFYSYSKLENAVGAGVTNAERMVPVWQERHIGDLVRAVPRDWMGGRFGENIGWKTLQVIPGRALVLEGWGAFVLVPANASTTRLLVRTRDQGTPSFGGVAASPVRLLVFEPVHFIMERRMLLGIKERAEREYLVRNLLAT